MEERRPYRGIPHTERRRPLGLIPKYPNYEPFHPPPQQDFVYPSFMHPPQPRSRLSPPPNHHQHSPSRYRDERRRRYSVSPRRRASNGRRSSSSEEEVSLGTEKYWDRGDSEEGSEVDLEEELHSLADHVHQRTTLLTQAIRSLRGKRLKAMIPPVLREIPVEDLERRCLNVLQQLDTQTVFNILDGKLAKMVEESTKEEEPPKEPPKPKKRKAKKIVGTKKGKKKEVKKKRQKKNDGPKTLMELLELEFRAKAIKALLRTQGVSLVDDFDIPSDAKDVEVEEAIEGESTKTGGAEGEEELEEVSSAEEESMMEMVQKVLQESVDEKLVDEDEETTSTFLTGPFNSLEEDQLRHKLLQNYARRQSTEQSKKSRTKRKKKLDVLEDEDVLELHAASSGEEEVEEDSKEELETVEDLVEDKSAWNDILEVGDDTLDSISGVSSDPPDDPASEEERLDRAATPTEPPVIPPEELEEGEIESDAVNNTEDEAIDDIPSLDDNHAESPSVDGAESPPVDGNRAESSPVSDDRATSPPVDNDRATSPPVDSAQPNSEEVTSPLRSVEKAADGSASPVEFITTYEDPKSDEDAAVEPLPPIQTCEFRPPEESPPPKEVPVTWYERWFHSKGMQKVVKTNKIQKQLRRKLKETDKKKDVAPPPTSDVNVNVTTEPIIGSIEEYEKLFGKKVVDPPDVPSAAPPNAAEDSDDADDLWGAIMEDNSM